MSRFSEYTVVRDSTHLERMWYLYHRLGIQSNILVAAQYSSVDDGQVLSKPLVLHALRKVVEAHPQLRAVGVPTPAAQEGNLGLGIAMLHSIDLESCVEFVDDVAHPGITAEIVERAHNEWLFTEPTRPWFKLLIVRQDTVVFVYHHLVGDGTSGYIFHREFLAALNLKTSTELTSPGGSPWVVYASPATTKISPDMYEVADKAVKLGKPWSPSMWTALWPVIVFWVIQLLFGSRLVFSKLPEPKQHLRSVTAVADDSQRTVSRIFVRRIRAERMKKILAACRANGVTFTPFFNVMAMITLANDYYPHAIYGGHRVSFDFRARLPPSMAGSELNTIGNRVGGSSSIERVQKYRRVFTKKGHQDKLGEKTGEILDAHRVWELARSNKEWIDGNIDPGTRVLQTRDASGPDLDYFVANVLPMVGVVLRPTYLVSNIGAFTPRKGELEGEDTGNWRVADVLFSGAPTNGHQGSRGPIFSVAGVKGGDTTIAAGWEEGVVSRELVEGILDATLARIEALTA